MESIIRLSAFFGVFVIMLAWELYAPRRSLNHSRWQRWATNISLTVISTVIIRFSVGAAAFITASYAAERSWGLLNSIQLPLWLTIAASIVLLDIAIYWQHRASHKWHWLWQLHKIHHTDQDFDVTTGIRFHPLEIIVSMAYKIVCIVFIGANPIAVIAFEIILSSCALFNHSNIRLPLVIDKVLRLFIVTPDMHRVHHSVIQSETDSNYSFSISLWDRLFGSYTAQPKEGHLGMQIGLSDYPADKDVQLSRLLMMPFKAKA